MTCSRNPAPVRKILGQWVDLFFLKETQEKKKKRNLELCTREASVVKDATTEYKKRKVKSRKNPCRVMERNVE